MSELSFDISCDWGLQAIVKEAKTKVINNIMEIPPSYAWVEDYYKNQENATLLLNELHQICTPNHHHNIISNTSSPSILLGDKSIGCPINEPKQNMKDVSYAKNLEIAPKRRRSKFKQTLVHQSTCDRILSDKWNWRKYGEKVIKGSPYPRSYYRCSNSGGCVARKQVEQSLSDPKKFVITYIDEHTHPYPTRRPSQAGRNSRRSSNNRLINNVSSELIVGVEDDDTSLECVGENSTSSSSNNIVFGDDFLLGFEGFDLDVLCDLQW